MEATLKALLVNFANIEVSVIIIFSTFVLALLGLTILSRLSMFRGLANNAPSLLTSLGITFTFMGVLRGLLDFDLNNINVGITELLEGMKVAFVSSVLGISLSFVFRILQIAFKPSESHDLQETMEEGFKELAEAIGGSHGESMTAQMANLQHTVDAKLDMLNTSFRSFAEDVVTKGTDSLVEALTKVIQEFNVKISEQLGDNFARFNTAIGEMMQWQQANKEEMSGLITAFQSVRESLSNAAEQLESIGQQTANIPVQMEALHAFSQKAEEEMQRLYSGLASLAEMRIKAQEALPSMEQGLRSVSDQMVSTTDTTLSSLRTSADEYQKTLSETLEGVRRMSETGESSIETATRLYTDAQTNLEKLIADSQSSMEGTVTSAISALNISIQQLDSSMQGEVQRCVEVMAKNVTRITEEFVNQYQRLSDATAEQNKRLEDLQKQQAGEQEAA